jgi:hypothetical protein
MKQKYINYLMEEQEFLAYTGLELRVIIMQWLWICWDQVLKIPSTIANENLQ